MRRVSAMEDTLEDRTGISTQTKRQLGQPKKRQEARDLDMATFDSDDHSEPGVMEENVRVSKEGAKVTSIVNLASPAGKKVTCANNVSYPIKGVGKILITISDGSDLCLPDVLYIPGIKKNLLSVSSLAKNGLWVIFEDDRCIVRDRENGYSLITTGTLENGLFVLDRYEKQIQACIAKTKTQAMQDAELWHARFGHVGYGSLMTLQRHNMVHDLSLLEMPPRHVCEGCVLGKMHRFAFSQDGSVRATRKLQLVHSDVLLGVSTQSKVSMVENETGCKVQTLCTDRGGEYMLGAFKDFLGKIGIKHQCTMPYTPQQNGVAKRKNRSLMEMARCMLKAKSLPHKLWMEAVACAAHVLNRCPTRALKTITPYESWYDRKPSVSYLRVFGCLAYAHFPQQLRGKLDDKAVKCIFVGYSSGSKGYRLYNPATNKIFESRDVIFAETTAQPMVAFDVPHMQTQDVLEGFLPSFVENQESQQVDSFDQSFDQHVTPHDVEEVVREEQEVLREERTLPKWVQKTLQDSKLDASLPRKTRAALWIGFTAFLVVQVARHGRARMRGQSLCLTRLCPSVDSSVAQQDSSNLETMTCVDDRHFDALRSFADIPLPMSDNLSHGTSCVDVIARETDACEPCMAMLIETESVDEPDFREPKTNVLFYDAFDMFEDDSVLQISMYDHGESAMIADSASALDVLSQELLSVRVISTGLAHEGIVHGGEQEVDTLLHVLLDATSGSDARTVLGTCATLIEHELYASSATAIIVRVLSTSRASGHWVSIVVAHPSLLTDTFAFKWENVRVTKEALYLVNNYKAYRKVIEDSELVASGASSVKSKNLTKKDAQTPIMLTADQMIKE
ncbi:hypothetical protein L7F22_036844 [Adiantum nelumboides]|nr:hypothetical protein [Adiantum nelumboides]